MWVLLKVFSILFKIISEHCVLCTAKATVIFVPVWKQERIENMAYFDKPQFPCLWSSQVWENWLCCILFHQDLLSCLKRKVGKDLKCVRVEPQSKYEWFCSKFIKVFRKKLVNEQKFEEVNIPQASAHAAAMLFHNGTRFLALMESSRTSKTSLFYRL